jgi:hypothetical protein
MHTLAKQQTSAGGTTVDDTEYARIQTFDDTYEFVEGCPLI